MGTHSSPTNASNAPDPQLIFDTASGFMRAKHLFVAAELGVFETLADGPKPLAEIARDLKLPSRTARIIVDAVTALGFLQREGDSYRNSDVSQAYLSGKGSVDMRAFPRFWNRISYTRWNTLEASVRLGRGASGEFNFTPEEWKIFSEGVEGLSSGQAAGLSQNYDFTRHRRLLDLGGGTGSFIRMISQHFPQLQSTLFEFPVAVNIARQKFAGTPHADKIAFVEGDFMKDPIPAGHDAILLANVVHVLTAEQNQILLKRIRDAASSGARLLLVDLWTNATHTDPLMAALMAGEFLVIAGNGDVYSVDEARAWFAQTGWHFVNHVPLGGPSSLVIAEA
jgi:hypothetical protein